MVAKASTRVFVIAILLVVQGCTGAPLAPVSDLSTHPHRSHGYHIVRSGESLYSISASYGYDYREVARWNGIPKPYRIYPGQKILLYPRRARHARARAPSRARRETARRHKSTRAATQVGHLRWVWPTRGPLLRTYSAEDPGKKGIDIGGRSGQPVVAAAAGEVVYSGSGLIRYGKLIIIKHNQIYFSAYAHNQKLLVKDGDHVRAGQQIADMGSTGTTRTMLHFEIRRNGKAVNPVPYLPKR